MTGQNDVKCVQEAAFIADTGGVLKRALCERKDGGSLRWEKPTMGETYSGGAERPMMADPRDCTTWRVNKL
jgi:hypothetical protein